MMGYTYVVKCEACGDWRLLPQEMVRSLAYSRAIKCNKCYTWGEVPQWLKDAVRREMQCKK
ncbi:hypothetical protein CathTA2_2444 [Caldalkalibacillus thermarum TA2.A1]|uniref:Uncharacterized protein n=1 Tax=Caldalkalibacillus thermarum (strain TA2.A1) TaxID=986075 RepID=F5L9D9_CALTT|nr:hypothetical protein CathTA2_2444 [Caldalkalibacillus thermarum TA2.A1]